MFIFFSYGFHEQTHILTPPPPSPQKKHGYVSCINGTSIVQFMYTVKGVPKKYPVPYYNLSRIFIFAIV